MGLLPPRARFLTTVAAPAQLPPPGPPEVAFVGRSNAGKSSAINRILGRRRLAFSSNTPGRTQALNFFALDDPEGRPIAYLVDTPGYGYAVAPAEVRAQWGGLAGRYLAARETLVGVVLIVDIRRLIGPRDVELLGWIPVDSALLVLLAKSDKLPRAQRLRAVASAREQLAGLDRLAHCELLPFSAESGENAEQAADAIARWIGASAADESTIRSERA